MSLLKNGNELFKIGNILQIFQVSEKKAHKGGTNPKVNTLQMDIVSNQTIPNQH